MSTTRAGRAVLTGALAVLLAMGSTACKPLPPSPPSPPPGGKVVLFQNGFEGLTVRRDVADVSIPDLEAFLPPGESIKQRGESEDCGVAERTDLGVTGMTDARLAVRAFVVTSKDVATPEDISVDSTLEEVRTAYGDAIVHHESIEGGGSQLIIDDQDRPGQDITMASQLFAFDLDASGTVTTLRAGGFPWLLGCATGQTEPPSPQPPSPGPGPDDLAGLTATFFGVGTVPIGGTVEQAEAALGVEFGEVEPIEDGCGLARTASGELGLVVVAPGGVQAIVVATDQIPFVSGNQHVGVGSTEQDVRESMPQWTGGDSETSLAGGERIVVTPREIAGYALLLEADSSGTVVQYRVGVDDYALQVDYC